MVRPPEPPRQDRDSAEDVRTLQILVWSVPGAILGGFLGLQLAIKAGLSPGGWVAGFLVGAAFGFAMVFFVARLIVEKAGDLAGTLYHPSGRSTPSRPEYSYAASLAVRGRVEDAIAAYEEACAENPEDPEPRLRIARLLRDELHRYEEAVLWLRRARDVARTDPGQEVLATREIVEIYVSKLGTPVRAAPDLARLAERFPGTPAGEWARRELEAVRAAGSKPDAPP